MKIIIDTIAVEYSDEGVGKVLLMLHGWKDSLRTFDPLVRELAREYRIVRLDMPGFGGTELPRTDLKLDDYVDFVELFIQKLGLDMAAIVGHSFGGRVILKGLARGVFHPQKAILIAAAGVSEKSASRRTVRNGVLKLLARAGKLASAPLPRSLRTKLRGMLYRSIGSDYHASGILKDIFINVVSENLSAAAEQVATPTLIMWGSEDASTPLADGEKLARLIRGSKIRVFDGATHFVHHEKVSEIARSIREFV